MRWRESTATGVVLTAEQMSRDPEWLYLMGTGRSGTTVLFGLLQSTAGSLGVGEFTSSFGDLQGEGRRCSCGEWTSDCPIWAPLARTVTIDDRARLASTSARVDRHRAFIASVWRYLRGGFKVADFEREALFESNLALGYELIIDSSKYASRALRLLARPRRTCSVLWVVRSPEGLLSSFLTPRTGEQPSKSALSVLVYQLAVLIQCRIVYVLSAGRVQVLRYEELISDPKAALDAAADGLGPRSSDALRSADTASRFGFGHMLTGNRVRFAGSVQLEGVAPSQRLTIWQRVVVTVMELVDRILVPGGGGR